MKIDEQAAVIDNDFTNHLAETRLADDHLIKVLNTIFSELDLSIIMHPLVYQHELLSDRPRVKMLFDSGVVSKAEFPDIHQNDAGKKAYYIYLVTNLYRALKGEPLPVSGEDIFTYWKRRISLGEVHSVATCLTCGCGIFLSDDGDSKTLQNFVEDQSIGKINVYNRKELVEAHLEQGETKLLRKDRQSLAHSAS